MLSKKVYRYLLPFLLLLLAAGYYAYHEYNRKPVSTTELLAAYELSVPELIGSFQKGEQLANQHYLGKVLSVTGIIKSIDKDRSGYPTVILGDTASLSSVRCSMAQKIAEDSLQYPSGTQVTIKGICTGFTPDDMGLGSDVILNRSVLLKSSNQ